MLEAVSHKRGQMCRHTIDFPDCPATQGRPEKEFLIASLDYDASLSTHVDEVEVDCVDNAVHEVLCMSLASETGCPNFLTVHEVYLHREEALVAMQHEETTLRAVVSDHAPTVTLASFLMGRFDGKVFVKLRDHVRSVCRGNVLATAVEDMVPYTPCAMDGDDPGEKALFYVLVENLIRQFAHAVLELQKSTTACCWTLIRTSWRSSP